MVLAVDVDTANGPPFTHRRGAEDPFFERRAGILTAIVVRWGAGIL